MAYINAIWIEEKLVMNIYQFTLSGKSNSVENTTPGAFPSIEEMSYARLTLIAQAWTLQTIK